MSYTLEQLADMSDEDFLAAEQGAEEQGTSLYEETEITDSEDEPVESEQAVIEDVAEEDSEQDGGEDAPESDEDVQEDEDTSEYDQEDESDDQEEGDEESEESTDDDQELTEEAKQLAELFEPFRANNTDISVSSVAEAKDLMRMGANYHKKMHTLKPHLKLITTLKNSNLLEEGKINHLIDVASGNPKAIAKLLADTKVSLDDIDTEEGTEEYSPVNHTISDSTHTLNETLDSMRDLPKFQDTMDAIKGWDESSKEVLVAHPERLKVLRAHKEDGSFDLINERVQKLQIFGKLENISDVEAYEMAAKQLMQEARDARTADTKPKAKAQAKPKVSKAGVASPKKGVVPRKKASSKAENMSIEELAELSDEEFEKVSSKYF